jgi:hypothetical protein
MKRCAKARWKKIATWSGRVAMAVVVLFAFAIGFGTPQADAEKMRVFADAVERWQHNPDFRKVQVEYVEMGSAAMNTRACFVNTTAGIMWLRSCPGLPAHLAVNPTSQAHYDNFTRGPLSAYLHLTDETGEGLPNTIKMIKYVTRNPEPTYDDIRNDLLLNYKFDGYKVAADEGAVASVRRLLDDVDFTREFTITTDVRARFVPHIEAVARRLGYPTDVKHMTSAQQGMIREHLDDAIRDADYELWRTKQVNDWLNGVWAQVYGTMYSGLITRTLMLRDAGRVLGPVMVMGWIALAWYRRKRVTEPVLAGLQPQLAIEGGELPGRDDHTR